MGKGVFIGSRCKVCQQRKPDVAEQYQVCGACLAIKVPCPQCGKPMPKYRKRGWLRGFCSQTCNKLAHPPTSEQAIRAGRTRFANHEYKSHQNEIARGKVEYRDWRKAVYERDNYTCQKCGAHNQKGVGKAIVLHPHHIKDFANHPDLRYDITNGVTLCDTCHRKEHKHVFIGRSRKRASIHAPISVQE